MSTADDAVRVTLLGGGIGCSRLAAPLADLLEPDALTLVVNTGDDHWRYGLRICPDLDTNFYALSGLQDRVRGWGVAADTFRTMEQLRLLGDDPWFALGDLDLALHLRRTALLRDGATLSEATSCVVDALDLSVRLLPMSDDPVESRLLTPVGELGFEEYFVQRRAEDPVWGVRLEGIDSAGPASGVLGAIVTADLVVIGPSNPVASIEPILALPGVRDALAGRRLAGRPTVAVTPIVEGIPINDEGEARRARCRAALLATRGRTHRATSVGKLLEGMITAFVLDEADASEAPELAALGLDVVRADTVVTSPVAGRALAEVVLSLGTAETHQEERADASIR